MTYPESILPTLRPATAACCSTPCGWIATWIAASLLALLNAACLANQTGAPGLTARLTDNGWRRLVDQGSAPTAETIEWRFFSNGAFTRAQTSDFSERWSGLWLLTESSPSTGVLFLSFGSQDGPRRAVVSVRVAGGELRLAELAYQAATFGGAEPPAAGPEQKTPSPETFVLWRALTASSWSSEGAPPAGYSGVYVFGDDGDYTAGSIDGECRYSGTWSLFSLSDDRGELRLSVPEHACDFRGPTEAFVRELPVELRDDKLRLYQTVYLPASVAPE